MCGIFGIWNLDQRPLDVTGLHRATEAISHRGPDDEGYLLVDSRSTGAVSCAGRDTDRRLNLPQLDRFHARGRCGIR